MNTVTRTERGWPGHSIGGRDCYFRRNTLLECANTGVRIVVSTLGDCYCLAINKTNPLRIDNQGYYGTMVFHARSTGKHWHADVARTIKRDSPQVIGEPTLETQNQADAMHEAVVKEITGRMEKGKAL